MKGLLFGGCSFTWGQGLYFYSDLPRQKYPLNEFTYNREELTDAHLRFKDTLRFPRLVANHFNTFEIVKGQNGGGEDETFDFFKTVFKNKINERHDHYVSDNIEYEDIEYIIIQTSQIWRNRFYFTSDGVEDFAMISLNNNGDGYNWDNFYKWLIDNNETIENVIKSLFKTQLERFEKEVKFYEDKGIKVRFLCWESEFYNELDKYPYLKEKFIPIIYNDVRYNTIRKMQDDNPHLKIKGDVAFFGENVPDDHHPSKECHRVIADNIIKRLESELK